MNSDLNVGGNLGNATFASAISGILAGGLIPAGQAKSQIAARGVGGRGTAVIAETDIADSSSKVKRGTPRRRVSRLRDEEIFAFEADPVAFGATVRSLRQAAGLSVAHFAKRIDVCVDYVYKMERGAAPVPGAERVIDMARVFRDTPGGRAILLVAGILDREMLESICRHAYEVALFAGVLDKAGGTVGGAILTLISGLVPAETSIPRERLRRIDVA